MKRVIVIRWLEYHSIKTREIENLCDTLNFKIQKTIEFKRNKPHPEHFLPQQKLEELESYVDEKGNNDNLLLVIDGQIRASQRKNLADRLDLEVMDKALIVLEIFKIKANSREIKLQIELANLIHTQTDIKSQIAQSVNSERQAMYRGRGQSVAEQASGFFRAKITKIKSELKRISKASAHKDYRESYFKVPIMGFYSSGKSTLFNVITGGKQETSTLAFSTMLAKSLRTRLFGFPLDFVDTVGLVNLPKTILNSFNNLLEPLFTNDLFIITLDSTISLELINSQIEFLGESITSFKNDVTENLKLIVVYTKTDLQSKSSIEEVVQLISTLDWVGNYKVISFRKDSPDEFKSSLRIAFDELMESELISFNLKSVTIKISNKIRSLMRVENEEWNPDGTSNIAGITLKHYWTEIKKNNGEAKIEVIKAE